MENFCIGTAVPYALLGIAFLTILHAFLALVFWANMEIKKSRTEKEGLGPLFRILLLYDKDFLRRHEDEIHDYIQVLESREEAEKKRK